MNKIDFLSERFDEPTDEQRLPPVASYSASYSPPLMDEYEEQLLLEHIESNFKIGFAQQNKHATTASNLMEFANDNKADAYRYYLWFLEKEENQWMDAKLFERALQSQTEDLEALNRQFIEVEKQYSQFQFEMQKLSSKHNDMSLRLLQQFENLMSSYPSLEKKLGVTYAILSIRGDIDELLKKHRELLSETFNRAETETDTFYQLNMKSRSLAEENAKDPVSQLITNKFAMRRLEEHKSAINVTKTLVNKTFE